MDTSPYQRLEMFWQSKGLKNMSAFAEAIKLSPGTISAIKQRGSRPSNVVMRAIQSAFPDVNPEWVLWGTGSMLKDGRSLAPFTATVEEPTAPFAPTAAPIANPDVITAFLNQMAEMSTNHRKEIRTLKREHREALDAQAETLKYHTDRMVDDFNAEKAELKMRIFELEGRLGIRPPTPEEAEFMQKQATSTKKVKGLRSYDEEQPVGAEMHASPGGLHDQPFTWLPLAEAEPSPLRLAA